jgi:hypothetical protein
MAHPVNPNNNRQNSIPYMQNMGFDDKYKIPAVVLTGEDLTGSTDTLRRIQVDSYGNIIQGDKPVTILLDYDGGDAPVYVGEAAPGTATSAAGWKIKRLTYSGANLTAVEWADGDVQADNIYDNRASISYS